MAKNTETAKPKGNEPHYSSANTPQHKLFACGYPPKQTGKPSAKA